MSVANMPSSSSRGPNTSPGGTETRDAVTGSGQSSLVALFGRLESLADLVAALQAQAATTAAIVAAHDLAEIGQPGERWDGAAPASLERVLFHLVQEYARHVGQLDVISELARGEVGE